MTTHLFLTLVALLVAAAPPDWSRFRGPNGTGVAETTNLPTEVGPTSNVVWKTALPPGHSSPVLTESRIFLTAHTAEKTNYQLLVIALDRATGKELWRREVPRAKSGRIENVNGPASPSPVTDGESVYAFFQEFGLISFTADGKERWRLPLGPFNIYYGFGASPMLVDDLLILPVDQDLGAYLLAIDRRTGKQRWKVERPHVISGYSTPTVYRPAGGPAQVVIPESFQLTSYAVADGKKLWWVRGLACEMKSVASLDGQTLYVNGWGFPQNQPGRQVATVPFDEGLKRYDKNGDGLVGKAEVIRRSADGQDARRRLRLPGLRSRPRREAGRARVGGVPLDARLGERTARGDAGRQRRHDGVRHQVALPAPRAAGALDAPLQGRAVHGQRQRHPDQLRPGHRRRAQAGPPEGRHRQVLRLAGRRRRPRVARQPGRHDVGGVGEG